MVLWTGVLIAHDYSKTESISEVLEQIERDGDGWEREEAPCVKGPSSILFDAVYQLCKAHA